MLHPRRTFIAQSLAFLMATGCLSTPVSSREARTASADGNQSGGGRGGGDGRGSGQQKRIGSGSGREGGNRSGNGQRCDNAGKAPVRLVINGKEAWQGSTAEFFDRPGAKLLKGGKRKGQHTLPINALVKNSNRKWRSVKLLACNGKQQSLDANLLINSPDRYIIMETRKKFLKLIERVSGDSERTLLRDIRTIEMN